MGRVDTLTPDQERALNIYSNLSPGSREFWLSQGEDLHRREPSLIASTADPFREAAPSIHDLVSPSYESKDQKPKADAGQKTR